MEIYCNLGVLKTIRSSLKAQLLGRVVQSPIKLTQEKEDF